MTRYHISRSGSKLFVREYEDLVHMSQDRVIALVMLNTTIKKYREVIIENFGATESEDCKGCEIFLYDTLQQAEAAMDWIESCKIMDQMVPTTTPMWERSYLARTRGNLP